MDSVFESIPDRELPDEFTDPEPLSERELEAVGTYLNRLIGGQSGGQEFTIQRCLDCGHLHTSYDPICPECASARSKLASMRKWQWGSHVGD